MWDLNGSPDEATRAARGGGGGYADSEGGSSLKTTSLDADDKNSTSSAIVIDDGGERSDGDEPSGDGKKRANNTNPTITNRRLFGFSFLTNNNINNNDDEDDDNNSSFSGEPPVTHQFFPVEIDVSGGDIAGTSTGNFTTMSHWDGTRYTTTTSDTLPAATTLMGSSGSNKPTELAQPMKKSRRGPRSRSSQYRGVTYYRRTGRWESHIWFAPFIFPLFST